MVMSWEVTSLIFLSWRTRKETCRQFKPGNFIRFWFISNIEFVNIRTWSDPWKQYKNENEAKVKKVLSVNFTVYPADPDHFDARNLEKNSYKIIQGIHRFKALQRLELRGVLEFLPCMKSKVDVLLGECEE